MLLKEPDVVHYIVQAVRQAVPEEIPVTAKIRLGYLDKDLLLDNARAVEAGGANGLTIHVRTKFRAINPRLAGRIR